MTRGILVGAVLAVAASGLGAPAQAAAPYVVYEAYRVKPNGPTQIPIRVNANGNTGPIVVSFLEVEPDDEGGYRSVSISVTEASGFGSTLWAFKAVPGHRYFMAAPPGKLRTLALTGYWRVRATTIGFRTLAAAQSDTDEDFAGTGVDRFNAATAPAGRYGSTVLAHVPCDGGVGSWTLSTNTEPEVDGALCAFGADSVFAETRRGTRWTLEGPVLGTHRSRYRLFVFDYPKR